MRYPSYPDYEASRWPEWKIIPKGWDARRLKFAATCNDEALPETTDPDWEMSYVDISSVDLFRGITGVETVTFENAPSRARRIVRPGDSIISTVRTYLKAIAHIEKPLENMIVSTGFAVVRPSPMLNSRFLGYALQGARFVASVVANSMGVSYPAINPSALVCIPIAYPIDLKEQSAIADFLDYKTGQIDVLIAKEFAPTLLTEYRTALITAATTGKIDVRGVKIPEGNRH
jgi:type I restriction enzyme, S subunit